MRLLGKNYDEDIRKLSESDNKIIIQLNKNTEGLNKIIEGFNQLSSVPLDNLQEQVITLAKVQAQHKEIITFLLNHTMVDSEDTKGVQEDLERMLKNIRRAEEKIK